MSNPEVNSSAVTPQHSTITSTTEDDNQINFETQKNSAEPDLQDAEEVEEGGAESLADSESRARSESVIKSPSKPLFVSSSTPVIKVVDSSQESGEKEDSSDARRYTGTGVIAQPSSQCASPQNSTSFLHSASSPTPSNPFLRTSSFSSNINSSSASDNSDLNPESSFIFAPPKLLTPFSNNNLFEASPSFLRPVFKAAESDAEESTPTIKTFISLNKEDIGTIKAPSFIKNSFDNSTSNFANGSSSSKESEVVDNNTDDSRPIFTFGQNLEDRVVFDSSKPSATADLKAEINSTSDNLISFSDVTNFDTSLKENSRDSIKSDDSKGDNENSACSSQKNGDSSDGVFKRKYEVITGEEDEQNVLSIHGKLYAWDTEKTSWIEKGRGHLRLNDVIKNDRLCSRLVMRTSGALRVILNAHVVAGMKFELANDNCLRFTNVDGIYMIKANPKDIDQLNSAIEYRLREITKRVKTDFHEAEIQDEENNPVVESI